MDEQKKKWLYGAKKEKTCEWVNGEKKEKKRTSERASEVANRQTNEGLNFTWKILGELCMRMAWNVDATPIPIMPSSECRWSAFIVVLSSSDVASNDELSIIEKHLKKIR